MFINSVLQKYPETKRPEALFNITNISSSYLEPYYKVDIHNNPLMCVKKEMVSV